MEKKKPPHTEYEKQLLIQLVQPHVSVLDSRRTDGVTLKQKQEAWEKLTMEFKNSPNITQPVTCKQLKKMWQNLKTKARNAKTIANQANKTGGGPQPSEIGALESQVLAVFPNIMPTIAVDIDCDIIHEGDHEVEADDDSAAWLSNQKRAIEIQVHPHSSISQECSPQPQPSISKGNIDSKTQLQESLRVTKKRKESNEKENTIEEIRKKIYIRELQNMEKKIEFDRNLQLEKHNKEMEILELKKQLVLKEFNK